MLSWLAFLFVGLPGLAQAQIFTVIHVDSGYYQLSRGRLSPITTGMQLKPADVVQATGGGKLFLVSNKQRYMHQAAGARQQFPVKNIKPAFGAKSCFTAIKLMGDFNAWLAGESQVAVIGQEWKIKLDPKLFPLTEGRYFSVVVRPGNTPTQLALPSKADTLILPSASFRLPAEAGLHSGTFRGLAGQLYYYDTPRQSYRRVVNFTPWFIDEAQLAEEAKLLLKGYPSLNALQKQLMICEYMSLVYARAELGQIKALMTKYKL